jgi:histidine phosphotransfer protein HptB
MNVRPAWVLPELFEGMEPAETASILAELIESYRTDTAQRLSKLRSAAARGDLATVRAEAHSIKGSSRQLGAEALATACQEIELEILRMPPDLLAERLSRLEDHYLSACSAMASYAIGS